MYIQKNSKFRHSPDGFVTCIVMVVTCSTSFCMSKQLTLGLARVPMTLLYLCLHLAVELAQTFECAVKNWTFAFISRGSIHRPYKSRALRLVRFRSKFRSRRAKSLACVLFKFGKLLQLGTFSVDLHETVVVSLRKILCVRMWQLCYHSNTTKQNQRPDHVLYLGVSRCVLTGWMLVAISPTWWCNHTGRPKCQ